MITLWMTLLACGDKTEDTATAETTETDSDTTEDTADSVVDGAAPPIRPMCKTLTVVGEYNGDIILDTTYEWTDLRMSHDGGWVQYNVYGSVTESYTVDATDWETSSTAVYACDGWCKQLSGTSTSGYVGEEPASSTTTTYVWDGNKQSTEDGMRYWVYNDMGYAVEFFDAGAGYENHTTMEYSCGDYWCKLLSTSTTTTIDGVEPAESFTEYTWDGLRQTWDGGYSVYNEYGYILETETVAALSQSNYRYTYDCE